MKTRIFSTLLALCMALALLPAPALAAGTAFATIGGAEYTSVADLNNAIHSATEAVAVEMTADAELDGALVIPDGKTVTLNLNGKKLSLAAGNYTIKVSGVLTILGAGEINNTTNQFSTVLVDVGGTLTIGEEDSDVGPVFDFNAAGAASAVKVNETGKLTIYAGTYNGSRAVQSYGETVIYGGTFNAYVQSTAWYEASTDTTYPSTMAIHGGTFHEAVWCYVREFKDSDGNYVYAPSSMTIEGGTFHGEIAEKISYEHTTGIADDEDANGDLAGSNNDAIADALVNSMPEMEVAGGTFSEPVDESYLAADVTLYEKADGKYYTDAYELAAPTSEAPGGAGYTRDIACGGLVGGEYLVVQTTTGSGEAAVISVMMMELQADANGDATVTVSYQTAGAAVAAWLTNGMPDLVGGSSISDIYANANS